MTFFKERANQDGFSLVPISPSFNNFSINPNDGNSWRFSWIRNGSPFLDDPEPVQLLKINEIGPFIPGISRNKIFLREFRYLG